MSTINVLHVIARMNVGGTARYVGELVDKIPNSALATGFVQGAELEDSLTTDLKIHRISHLGRKISPVDDFRAWFELRALIKTLKPDILHTHTFKAGLIGRLVAGDHKRVHTFHGHLFGDQSFSPLTKKLIVIAEKFLAGRSDVLISVGDKVGYELRCAGIGKNQQWVSIPPGVNPLPTIDRKLARMALNLRQDDFIFGWMARMTSVKNPSLMIEIARELPNFTFVMAGGGELLESIRTMAPANVLVVGWVDPSIFWSAVDCAISTSDNEGMPIALIEAQLAHLPVIATNVGAVSEVIENGVTGIITPKAKTYLVQAIQKLAGDIQLQGEMSANAVLNSTKKFNLDEMLAKHSLLYSSLIDISI